MSPEAIREEAKPSFALELATCAVRNVRNLRSIDLLVEEIPHWRLRFHILSVRAVPHEPGHTARERGPRSRRALSSCAYLIELRRVAQCPFRFEVFTRSKAAFESLTGVGLSVA